MRDLVPTLEALDAALGDVIENAFADDVLGAASDEAVVAALAVAARITHRAEASLVEGAAKVDYRAAVPRDERITTRFACGSMEELLQRVTRVSSRSASAFVKAGRWIIREVAPSSGEVLPADFPGMRAALTAGHLGVDGVLAVTGPLTGVASVAGRAAHLAADEELAAAARGEGVEAAPPASVDELRALATVWATYLDQDGAEPREVVAMRKRGITFGVCRDGLILVRGNLLPEVAAQWQLVNDSILNPKTDDVPAPPGPHFADIDTDAAIDAQVEHRTLVQRQHDVLATMLAKLAGSGVLPTLGSVAPTLVVSVREEDIRTGRGYAHSMGVKNRSRSVWRDRSHAAETCNA